MLSFSVIIKKFASQGEKTGWTYFEIDTAQAQILKGGERRSYRVKGFIDKTPIEGVALYPMRKGGFIFTLNAALRKKIQKKAGDEIKVQLMADNKEQSLPKDLILCLKDEPDAMQFFQSLTKGHQAYFGKWIESAKTVETKTRRISHIISAMLQKQDYGTMIRSLKKQKL